MAVTCKATSGDKGKFEATVKSVLIGAVPDRGGRPAEGRAAAAAASMPAWAPRSAGESAERCSLTVKANQECAACPIGKELPTCSAKEDMS